MPVWAPVKLKNESTAIIISEQDKKCSDDQGTDAKVCSVKKTESACKPKSVDFKSSSVKGVKDATPEKLRTENAHKPEMKDLDLDQVNIEKKDNNNNGPGKSIQEVNIVQEKGSTLELDFCVKGGETQTVSVLKDDEELFTSTSRNTGPRFGDMNCSLEDLFGPGEVNLQNIKIEVQAGCLKVKIIKNA